MLSLTRQFGRLDAALRRGTWESPWAIGGTPPPPWPELAGKTLAILGYGHIGRCLARRATAFDMTGLAIRRDTSPPGSHARIRAPSVPRAAERPHDAARLRLDGRHAARAREAHRRQHPPDRPRRVPGESDSTGRLTPRLPFFYGWVIVAVAFVTMALGVNARTAFSLLFPPILDEFGWERGMTAGAFSFGFLVSAALSPFVGRLMDRRGPRVVIETGVVFM